MWKWERLTLLLVSFGLKPSRSLKAMPTGNDINPELSPSNWLLFFIHAFCSETTSAVRREKRRGGGAGGGERGLRARAKPPRHVLPNWFNDRNYLLGCMLHRGGRLMASQTYADRRKLEEEKKGCGWGRRRGRG